MSQRKNGAGGKSRSQKILCLSPEHRALDQFPVQRRVLDNEFRQGVVGLGRFKLPTLGFRNLIDIPQLVFKLFNLVTALLSRACLSTELATQIATGFQSQLDCQLGMTLCTTANCFQSP